MPYKGVGPMLTDLIGGQVEFATAALPSVQQHLQSGTLRAIGMGTAKRVPAAPDIPTFVEQGLPGYVVEAWFAVIGPKGMSAAEVKRVHDAVVAAFADPGGQGGDGEAGQRHQRRPPSEFAPGLLPDRAREVRGHRARRRESSRSDGSGLLASAGICSGTRFMLE